MADKTTVTEKLSLVHEFRDGDDRTIALDNPREDLTAADIKAVETYIKQNKLFIGDKAGADFVRFKAAKTVKHTHIEHDLN